MTNEVELSRGPLDGTVLKLDRTLPLVIEAGRIDAGGCVHTLTYRRVGRIYQGRPVYQYAGETP